MLSVTFGSTQIVPSFSAQMVSVDFLAQEIPGGEDVYALDPLDDGQVELYGVSAQENDGNVTISGSIRCSESDGNVDIEAVSVDRREISKNGVTVFYSQ